MSGGRRQHEEHSILPKVDIEGPRGLTVRLTSIKPTLLPPLAPPIQRILSSKPVWDVACRDDSWGNSFPSFSSIILYFIIIIFIFSVFDFFSFLLFRVLINCFVVKYEEICGLDEFGCSFEHRFAINHPWSYCGIILLTFFPSHSLSTLPDLSPLSHFAPLSLFVMIRSLTLNVDRWYAATAVRSDMNHRDYSLSSQVLSQHPLHPSPPTTPPHLISSYHSPHQKTYWWWWRSATRANEYKAKGWKKKNMWMLGQLLVLYPIINFFSFLIFSFILFCDYVFFYIFLSPLFILFFFFFEC